MPLVLKAANELLAVEESELNIARRHLLRSEGGRYSRSIPRENDTISMSSFEIIDNC